MVLTVKKLTSGYLHRPVIRELDLVVRPFEIVGLIGLNGAGKSTLMKTLVGALPEMVGEVTLNGYVKEESPLAYRQQLGYIPERPVLYDYLTLAEHLELTATSYELDDAWPERAAELLRAFRLVDRAPHFPTQFSKGMQQKVMIIQALLVQPSLLLIDEPFVGLDPLAARMFRKYLKEYVAGGGAVLLTTHLLYEAERLCDRFYWLQDGKWRAQGTVSEVAQTLGHSAGAPNLEKLYVEEARRQGEDV